MTPEREAIEHGIAMSREIEAAQQFHLREDRFDRRARARGAGTANPSFVGPKSLRKLPGFIRRLRHP